MASPATLDPERVISFAVRWALHGGGPADEIFARFGVDPAEYFTAVLSILESSTNLRLSDVTVGRIGAVARRRIWLGE